jgi:PAS domain S-box-containing protein
MAGPAPKPLSNESRQTRRLQQISGELIADAAPALISYVDSDLRYRFVNQRYEQWFELACEDLLGRTLEDVLGAPAVEKLSPYLRRVLAGEHVHFDMHLPYVRGRARWVECQYVPDRGADGRVEGFFALVVDVTERKQADAALAENARQKDALYRFAERLQSADSREDIYEAALNAITEALRCERASVLLFDGGGVMRFVAWRGLSDAYRLATEGHSPWAPEHSHPLPIRMDDVAVAILPDALRATIVAEGIAALAFIPLVAQGRLIGKFMTYFDAPHAFSDDEVELAQTIARLLAAALERRRVEDELRRNEQRFRQMIDALPAAIYTTDAHGAITHFNPAAVALAGRAPVLGEDHWCVSWKLLHPDGSPMRHDECPMAIALTENRAVRGAEAILQRPDGSRRWFTPYPTPLHDDEGRLTGGINMLVDITERKQVEETLRDADRRKDEFLAMLAHELRNPLAPITNAVHLMRRARIEDPVQQQASAMIDRQASRLTRLVDDLLEVSRITTGRIQLHLERIELGGVIERALETSRSIIEQHRHALLVSKPASPVWLYADAARLEQVLVNLLNNAAKYTSDGGRIDVEARVEERQATISVRDTGVGIEQELLPRIFDLFTQAERTLDRSQGGLGIGLCLVQRLVTMHGGSVEARSVVGQGSEFIVRLPALAAEEPAYSPTAANAAPRESRRSLRVVVVDDNVDAAQSLGMLLEGSGHSVRLAHGGRDALEAVRDHRPQVVLLDIGLPQIDGYEVARRLRERCPREAITLVAMTGYGQAADRERSHAAGFDHHLVKPANYAELERILAEATPLR